MVTTKSISQPQTTQKKVYYNQMIQISYRKWQASKRHRGTLPSCTVMHHVHRRQCQAMFVPQNLRRQDTIFYPPSCLFLWQFLERQTPAIWDMPLHHPNPWLMTRNCLLFVAGGSKLDKNMLIINKGLDILTPPRIEIGSKKPSRPRLRKANMPLWFVSFVFLRLGWEGAVTAVFECHVTKIRKQIICLECT